MNEMYKILIIPARVANRHSSIFFHYSITRVSPQRELLVTGAVRSREEAREVVDRYLRWFGNSETESPETLERLAV